MHALRFGAIEGGGTKFLCAVGEAPDRILARACITTRDAATTLAECVDFFRGAERDHGRLAAIGVGCFGPIDLDRSSRGFGCMLRTPKSGWAGANLLEPLQSAFEVPIALDTDVGAAALAEWKLGTGRNCGSLAYVTVGTGIGGAVVPQVSASGRLMHAEMGHLRVRREPGDDDFEGVCPFHGDCLEGLASGPAIVARWGASLESLPDAHAAVQIVSGYLGQLAASISLMTSVQRIAFGGGVMHHPALLPRIRAAALGYLNGYLEPLCDPVRAEAYVSAPELGDDAGIVGGLLLAQQAADR
jgi:fructokinase